MIPICKEAVTLYGRTIDEFRRQLLTETLRAHGGNRTRAARALGLQRTYLIRLIREYGISVPAKSRQTDANAE